MIDFHFLWFCAFKKKTRGGEENLLQIKTRVYRFFKIITKLLIRVFDISICLPYINTSHCPILILENFILVTLVAEVDCFIVAFYNAALMSLGVLIFSRRQVMKSN